MLCCALKIGGWRNQCLLIVSYLPYNVACAPVSKCMRTMELMVFMIPFDCRIFNFMQNFMLVMACVCVFLWLLIKVPMSPWKPLLERWHHIPYTISVPAPPMMWMFMLNMILDSVSPWQIKALHVSHGCFHGCKKKCSRNYQVSLF